ncbi:MAG: sporulation initiation factor Spo0A C-terminal domain-containing protein [Clostridia bacterium]|nr:sporulation initiation factor Spo0A C-terminal domain-containing protein [Clostridia bacterium]
MERQMIQHVLRTLGIGRQYLGYNITIRAVRMVLLDENCLFCVKQGIFLPISFQQQCDWRTIERNIRTVIHRAWTVNPEFLGELAGYPLHQEPTVTEFIEMIASYIMRTPGPIVTNRASISLH